MFPNSVTWLSVTWTVVCGCFGYKNECNECVFGKARLTHVIKKNRKQNFKVYLA